MTSLRILALAITCALVGSAHADDWFEAFKDTASDADLYRLLQAMPKGGDLHNHNSGSVYVEDWYAIATAQAERGYRYFTKVRINNCRSYADVDDTYLLLFRNIVEAEYQSLDACERSEYVALEALNEAERRAWMNSLRLDASDEGREEFFGKHWQRMNALYRNPYIRAEALYHNMRTLADDGAIYLEAQVAMKGARFADGTAVSPDQMADIFRARLARDDARATGVTARLQLTLLRFTPFAESELRDLYRIANNHRDLIVGLNMVGREDDDRGYPRRFLETLRELRRSSDLPLAIHAGEVDEPNAHVRDTLLLGADRIGHGLNLITDDETMLDMRNGRYLIEINLISNLLLEYVDDYAEHPFPEFLRTDIPVTLSTDDRGMWDSTLTDEYFVAVKAFDLTWPEITTMLRNSIDHAFVEAPVKQALRARLDDNLRRFERRMQRRGLAKTDRLPDTRLFICARFSLCISSSDPNSR